MIIGFTGTRRGMTPYQLTQFSLMLGRSWWGPRPYEFHHGGARGADQQAVAVVRIFAAAAAVTVNCHPCPGVVLTTEESAAHPDEVWHEVFPPLVRNQHIAAACDVLIAAPYELSEIRRSGTWATVRYARAAGKPVILLARGELP